MSPIAIFLFIFAAIAWWTRIGQLGMDSRKPNAIYVRWKWALFWAIASSIGTIFQFVELARSRTLTQEIGVALGAFLLVFFSTIRDVLRLWPKAMAERAQARFAPEEQSFFWQGVLILLPVFLLAVLGGLSLKWDRTAAERDGRKAASIEVGKLKTAIENHHRPFFEYGNAIFAWAEVQKINAGVRNGPQSAEQELAIAKQRFPDIDFSRMPFRDNSFEQNPEGWIFIGHEEMVPPDPAEWPQQLSPLHQEYWKKAKQAFAVKNWEEAEASLDRLLVGNPNTELRENAAFLLLRIKTRNLEGDELVGSYVDSGLLNTNAKTESGLLLRDLVLHEFLIRLPAGQEIPNEIWKRLGRSLVRQQKSFFSDRLLVEGRRVAGTEPSSAKLIEAIENLWKAADRTVEMVQQFTNEHPPSTWSTKGVWLTNRNEVFLTTILDEARIGTNTSAAIQTKNLFTVRFAPIQVVERALSEALDKSNVSLLPFASMVVEIDGKTFTARNDHSFAEVSYSELPVLASSDAELITFPWKIPISIQALLTNRDQLYLRQQERALWLSLLILAASASALVGFVSAQKSFHRQLRLNEMKSNFVSSVSHELRAPIASVRLMAEGLERERITEPEKQKEYFRFIGQECRRLSSLIENVLDFSRIEQGRKQYEFEPTDLVKLVGETVKLMEPYAAEKAVKLCCEMAELPTTHAQPVIDGRAIQQALINLIDNAIKHSPSGAVVTLRVADAANVLPASRWQAEGKLPARRQQHVALCVEDHGPGIPPHEQEKIFERFYRLGSELRRETQGIGIGLSIVKHIIEAHGGRVLVESETGKGSRFTVELPVGNAERSDGVME